MAARSGQEWIIFEGHPSWRSMLGFHLKGFLVAIAAGILAGLVSAGISGHASTGWVVAAVLAVFVIVISRGVIRRWRTTYTITSRRLMIEVGLLGREVHETLLEQIQNVGCAQSAAQRLLGVGSVTFDTAGGAGYDFALHGVAHPRQIARAVHDALGQRSVSRV